ncbi:MAG TPA: type II secretion system F family protein [Candidatus Bathyarchaeia archaeon]|nr:type II secretion system F family protein [Candidatus Bathyarchaeia archaeon]
MPLFKYRAVDGEGNPTDGTMEGPSAHQVVVALQQQGLAVNAVRPVARQKPAVASGRLSWHDIEQLNSQLVMATKSSLPLAPSIGAMANEIDNPRIKRVLDDVRQQLEAGHPLEQALSRHPKAFSPVYRALVSAGETAGNLPGAFRALLDYSKSMADMKSNLRLALMYPLLVVAFAVLVIVGLLWKVVPQYADIFNEFGKSLPAPTQFLINLSDFMRSHGLFILCAFILAAGLAIAYYFNGRRSEPHYWVDWLKLRTPVLRRVFMLGSLMQFTRALALLLEARVPLLESLELAGASAGNAVLHRRVRFVARDLNAGSSIAQALQNARIFDSGSCWLIANAEKNGNLEETIEALSDEHARALAYLYRSFTTLIGPAVIVAVGLFVGFIILSLYLPIFSLGDAISGDAISGH